MRIDNNKARQLALLIVLNGIEIGSLATGSIGASSFNRTKWN